MLEAFGHHDADAMGRTRDRVLDRLDIGFKNALRDEPRHPSVLVEGELERCKDRIVDRGHDQAEDVKQRALRRMLAGHDIEQRLALLGRGALVDDGLHLAVALMKGAGKIHGYRKYQPIELGALEVSLGDLHPDQPLQVPWVGGALKSQGQPKAQLQFFIHSPSRRQSDPAMASLPSVERFGSRHLFAVT